MRSPGVSTHSKIHIPKADGRLPAQYYDIHSRVNSRQMAKDLSKLMPAGTRVNRFTAGHEDEIQ